MAATARAKRSRKRAARSSELVSAHECSGLVRGRFRTTRDARESEIVEDFRRSICGIGAGPNIWVRAERPGESRVRPNMMRVKSLWKRREKEPGLYMSPASLKDVRPDILPFYPKELERDVLFKHSGFLLSEGKQPSNLEFLVGARRSSSEFHRDGGLVCWVTLEVLEGKKRVVVMPREWNWGDGDGDLDWEGVREVCKTEGGYSTVLGPGEAITFWSDAPHAAFNEEPALSLSFAWLVEEELVRSLVKTLQRELGQNTGRWVQGKMVALIQTAVVRAFARFQSATPEDREEVLLLVYRLLKVVQECHDRKALLPKKGWRMALTTIRTEFFRRL